MTHARLLVSFIMSCMDVVVILGVVLTAIIFKSQMSPKDLAASRLVSIILDYIHGCSISFLKSVPLSQAWFLAIKKKTEGKITQNSREKLKTQENNSKFRYFFRWIYGMKCFIYCIFGGITHGKSQRCNKKSNTKFKIIFRSQNSSHFLQNSRKNSNFWHFRVEKLKWILEKNVSFAVLFPAEYKPRAG